MAETFTRYDLIKDDIGWHLRSGGKVVFRFATKGEATSDGRLQSVLDRESGGRGTVRIHTEIGGIDEERTLKSNRPVRSGQQIRQPHPPRCQGRAPQ